MITKNLLTGICSLFMALLFVGYDKDEVECLESHFSYRDGVYEGKNLSVTLNGEEVSTVISISVKSTLLGPNIDPE